MAEMPAWHTRPIFITSTFRDMGEERDYLRDYVFLELEERLKARRTHLEPIDLRWGVETVTTEEEQAKEMLVLKVCLAEVERSRPFLIGLIGDRYGWIPPEARMAAAAEEAGFKQSVTGRSVTDLEINFGVLDSPEQKQRSFFYFRDPLPYDEMSSELAAQYSDAHNSESKDAADKLAKLKQHIKTTLPDRVRHYHAKWDATNSHVTGLEAWGQQVLEDLWQELDRETRAFVNLAEVTWQSQERFALEQFIENRAQGFVGRRKSLKQALELATSPDTGQHGWGLGITGKPGSGKSAVFSQLNRQLNDQDVLVLAHAAGISPSSTQVDQMLHRWIDELAQVLSIQDPIPDDAKADDAEEIFRSLLSQASAQQRVVILIDALNQFERTNRAKFLTWLPKTWPDNARLITTAIPGTETEVLFARDEIDKYELPLLDETDARDIATHICDRYHRKLNPEVLELLLAKRTKNDQPSYGNPLWLNMAIEEINLLDADDFARADQDFTGTPEERLHQLIVSTAKELPGSVTQLYDWILDRIESLFDERWSCAFVNLIAVSRAGWRESDLRVLMPQKSGIAWDDLNFAHLRRLFRAHVTQRGQQAQWDFTHQQMRESVLARNLPGIKAIRELHSEIATYLEKLEEGDPLRETETMVHWTRAMNECSAARYYGRPLGPEELLGATRALTAFLADGREPGALSWALSLLEIPELQLLARSRLCRHYLVSLTEYGRGRVTRETICKLLERVRDTLEALIDELPIIPFIEVREDLALCLSKLVEFREAGLLSESEGGHDAEASMAARAVQIAIGTGEAGNPATLVGPYVALGAELMNRGDFAQAVEEYTAARVVVESVRSPLGTAMVVAHLADAYCSLGNLERALEEYLRAIEVVETSAENPGTAHLRYQTLAVCRRKLGDFMLGVSEYDEALSQFEAFLDAAEQLLRTDPGNAEYRWELSQAHLKVGDTRLMQNDLSGALVAYKRSRNLAKSVLAEDPTDDRRAAFAALLERISAAGCSEAPASKDDSSEEETR